MGETTNIAWCDKTFNPVIGCTKVGPGCNSCYAEAMDNRFGGGHWGTGAPRRRTSPANWDKVRKWNRHAVRSGVRPWIFVASMADVFDNEWDEQWRADLWDLMFACQNLNFQVVTKRIGNAAKMLPANWNANFPHVGIIATVVTQEECDRDLPKLLAVDCAWRGLSIEPQLERVIPKERCDWVITGGESDQGSARGRPYNLAWAEILCAWGRKSGTPIFVKQLGSNIARGCQFHDRAGADPLEWPPELRVRDMPRGVSTTLRVAA
jgi:protein gp37